LNKQSVNVYSAIPALFLH